MDATKELLRIPTEINGSATGDDFLITRDALDKISFFRQENSVEENSRLRIGTKSGGCSGMSYMLGFDDQVNDDDKTFEVEGLGFVIDGKSLFYLMSITLDYKTSENGAGFFFDNPNDFKTCGCGGGGH